MPRDDHREEEGEAAESRQPRRRAAQEPKAPSLLGEEPDASAALHSDAGVLNEEGAFQRGLFL